MGSLGRSLIPTKAVPAGWSLLSSWQMLDLGLWAAELAPESVTHQRASPLASQTTCVPVIWVSPCCLCSLQGLHLQDPTVERRHKRYLGGRDPSYLLQFPQQQLQSWFSRPRHRQEQTNKDRLTRPVIRGPNRASVTLNQGINGQLPWIDQSYFPSRSLFPVFTKSFSSEPEACSLYPENFHLYARLIRRKDQENSTYSLWPG